MKARDKAQRLVNLAVHQDTPDHEAIRAAVQAAKLIAKHDLLSSPLDDILDGNETVKAAKTVFETATDPDFLDSLKKIGKGIAAARGAASESSGRRRRRRRR